MIAAVAALLALPTAAWAADRATIWVSEGVAGQRLVETTVSIQGRSVMELLQSVARVETAYGGGFVAGINGLFADHAGTQADWFYYVNGRIAAVGAAQYLPVDGDHIWWIYQTWERPDAVPQTIVGYHRPSPRE
ncbi:MAG: DUF4430 domain-containing protein [Candidatus Omnitrophica bacterium]|nr:DUF4430 domain-containing protein [Candidatus Omnitrophota bacterium]